MGVVLSLSISRMRLRFAGSLYEKLLIAPQIHQLIKLSAFPKIELLLNLKTEMAPDSAGVRSGLVSLSDRFESSSGIYSSR